MGQAKQKKDRDATKGYFAFPAYITKSPNFFKMSGSAMKVLMFICHQFRGGNNGDLSATLKMCKPLGVVTSQETLTKALMELEYYGFIVKTRQGGKNFCSLYAITWLQINECADRNGNTKIGTFAKSPAPGGFHSDKPKFKYIPVPRNNPAKKKNGRKKN